jgi:hypothetical protein
MRRTVKQVLNHIIMNSYEYGLIYKARCIKNNIMGGSNYEEKSN